MQLSSVGNSATNYINVGNFSAQAGNSNSYFAGLKEKYDTVSMNMSDAYNFNTDSNVTLNISPEYIEKAESSPEVASNIERLSGLAESFPQYLGTHNTLPDGTKVTGVSFVVNENGGVSCNCTYEKSTESKSDSIWDRVAARITERREAAKEQSDNLADEEKNSEARKLQQKGYNEYFAGSAVNYLF